MSSLIFFLLAKNFPVLQARVFYPSSPADEEIEQYLENRDPELGWPGKKALLLNHDRNGARLSPANAAIGGGAYCFEFYGDLFTYSAGVDHADAWPNILAERIGCKVLNFGVFAYGVDQAVLRHRQTGGNAKNVGLVIYPDDIKRNLNQQRSLLAPTLGRLDFKPRFVVRQDEFHIVGPSPEGLSNLKQS